MGKEVTGPPPGPVHDIAARPSGAARGYSDDALRSPAHQLFADLGNKNDREYSRYGSRQDEADAENGVESEDTTEAQLNGFGLNAAELNSSNGTRPTNGFFSQRQPSPASSHPLENDSPESAQTAVWEQFERLNEDVSAAEAAEMSQYRAFDRDSDDLGDFAVPENDLLKLDYKVELPKALQKGEADMITRCLFAASRADDVDFIKAIPEATFSEIVSSLDPSNFVAKLGSAHVELSSAIVEAMHIAPMKEIAYSYSIVLRRIVRMRRDAGVKPTLPDYTLLLRAARDLGSYRMASDMWDSLAQDGHSPTTTCYNYYMSAIVWNGRHNSGSRHKVRTIPFFMMARTRGLRGVADRRFRNYRVGRNGVRELTMKTFNHMLANGLLADEESFRILITACAREGDVDMVKSILKKVWGIDVAALMEANDEGSIAPKQFAEHSPLRPSPALLFTLAHAFGINSEVPTALRVVDFVSRHYDLSISLEVWAQLFEWTFVLSTRPTRLHRRENKGTEIGHLPTRSVTSLWETMTGAPYLIKPTMGMYHLMIKSQFKHRNTPGVVARMEEAHQILLEHSQESLRAFLHLNQVVDKQQRGEELDHESVEHIRQDWEYRKLIRKRDEFWFKRWVRLLLATFSFFNRKDFSFEYTVERLPGLLWEWRRFAPARILYETPTGFVDFVMKPEKQRRLQEEKPTVRPSWAQPVLELSRRYIGDDWVNSSTRHQERRAEEVFRRSRLKSRNVRSISLPGGEVSLGREKKQTAS